MGFEVSCCDVNPTYFSIPELSIDIGDLNQMLPYPEDSFNYVICLDGIEHTENPSNTIREFRRILRAGGKLFLSIPNFLNIERRVRYLFTGGLSKIPSHETIQNVWNSDLSMAHLSPMGYPLLKFVWSIMDFASSNSRRIVQNLKWYCSGLLHGSSVSTGEWPPRRDGKPTG